MLFRSLVWFFSSFCSSFSPSSCPIFLVLRCVGASMRFVRSFCFCPFSVFLHDASFCMWCLPCWPAIAAGWSWFFGVLGLVLMSDHLRLPCVVILRLLLSGASGRRGARGVPDLGHHFAFPAALSSSGCLVSSSVVSPVVVATHVHAGRLPRGSQNWVVLCVVFRSYMLVHRPFLALLLYQVGFPRVYNCYCVLFFCSLCWFVYF